MKLRWWHPLTPMFWLGVLWALALHMWQYHIRHWFVSLFGRVRAVDYSALVSFASTYFLLALSVAFVVLLFMFGMWVEDLVGDVDRLKSDVVNLDGKGGPTHRIECPAHLGLGEICLDTNDKRIYIGLGSGRVVPIDGDDSVK